MEKDKELIVLDTDDLAAKITTVTGWVSRNGRFYGQDERMARYDGSTHKRCECGHIHEKTWVHCEVCRSKAARERYDKMPFREWDGNEPVCMHDGDKYFFSAEEIDEYLEENELNPEDLLLVICDPNYAQQIGADIWADDLPEDGDIPKELDKKIDELNTFIKTLPPLSYSGGKYRTEYAPAAPNPRQ